MTEINNNEILNEEELDEVAGGAKYGDGTRYIIEYKVVKGDNLTKIARKFNSTINSIMALNPIIKNKNVILVGWTLKICVNDK